MTATAPQLTNLKNPFPGLRPFEVEDSDLFFGRDAQVDGLLQRLGARRLLAVVGTSGSGKSSLVKAGLIPAIEGGYLASAGSQWRTLKMKPGHEPVARLAATLHPLFEVGVGGMLELLQASLERSSLGLVEVLREARLPAGSNVLLVVDQFEEVFTRREVACRERGLSRQEVRDEYSAFVQLLLGATSQTEIPVYVVLTMRSDYLGAGAEFRGLPEALNDSQYLVPRLTREQLQQAIQGPAAVGGGRLAPRLVQRLLNEVIDDQDQLPVLQHALMCTWVKWSEDTKGIEPIDLAHYVSMESALSDHADQALKGLDEEGLRVARVLFQSLVNQDAEGRRTSRPTSIAQIARNVGVAESSIQDIVGRFQQRDQAFLFGDPVVEITHESLIRRWKKLGEWLDAEIDSAQWFARVKEWMEIRTGAELDGALKARSTGGWSEAWAERYGGGFTAVNRKIEAGAAERKRVSSAERRRVWFLGLAALAFASVAVFAMFAKLQADKAAKQAESRAFAAKAEQFMVRGDPSQALDFGIKAWLMAQTDEAHDALAHAAPQLVAKLEGHTHGVWSAAFSPDGQRIVTASEDRTARVWNAASGQLVAKLEGHTLALLSAAFSPDGQRIVTASDDRTARVFQVFSFSDLEALLK